MESILEQQRRYHEERERLLDSMVKEMLLKKISVSCDYSDIIKNIANYCSVIYKCDLNFRLETT